MHFNKNEILTLIVIFLQTTQTWPNKLKFKDENIKNDIFIDEHEQSDLIPDYMNFLKVMEELISFIINFEKDDKTKTMFIYLILEQIVQNFDDEL